MYKLFFSEFRKTDREMDRNRSRFLIRLRETETDSAVVLSHAMSKRIVDEGIGTVP